MNEDVLRTFNRVLGVPLAAVQQHFICMSRHVDGALPAIGIWKS